MSAAGAVDPARRIPRLAADCDPTGLDLTPEEGFLLSRIDGATSQALLREVGGLPAAEVDRCLEGWARAGVIVFDGDGRGRTAAGASGAGAKGAEAKGAEAKGTTAAGANDAGASDRGAATGKAPGAAGPKRESATAGEHATAAGEPGPATEVDPSLDMPVEVQRAVQAMEARLDRPYHEILGVGVDADARTIKRAYFGLSKQFHPDRYFRRNIGPYAERLERVFRRVAEAYELLSDPTTRAEIQRSLGGGGAEAQAGAGAGGGAAAGAAEQKAKGDRLRRRRVPTFSPLTRALVQRRAKAKNLFESGMAAFAAQRWVEAAGAVRLAIAFDPHNEHYRSRFGEVRAKAADVRFAQLSKEAESALSYRDGADALRLFEEALHHKPFDVRANHMAAKLAWVVANDLHRAKEYAARACDMEPDDAECRKMLGQIYKAAGLKANARRELQRAARLDPKDAEVRAELKSL